MTMNPEPSNPHASRGTGPNDSSEAAKDATRQEADRLKGVAQSAASDVAGTAKEESRAVKDEASEQAHALIDNVQDQVAAQASTQQQRLADQSRTVTDDLQRISRGERPESEMVTRAVSNVAQRAETFTRQLETKEPMDFVDDVRRFASRRPGTFLLLAAGAGLLAGRLTRGLRDANSSQQDSEQRSRATGPAQSSRPVAPSDPTEPVRSTAASDELPNADVGGR